LKYKKKHPNYRYDMDAEGEFITQLNPMAFNQHDMREVVIRNTNVYDLDYMSDLDHLQNASLQLNDVIKKCDEQLKQFRRVRYSRSRLKL
jgi:hypothetical protein